MSLETLGQSIYNAIVKEHNISYYLKTRPLNILDCEEADIEYDEVPIVDLIDEKRYESSVTLDDTIGQTKFNLAEGVIYNNLHERVGYYEYWQDGDVPMRFKDGDENILDPINNKPLHEYILEHQYSRRHQLSTNRVYREYKYDICFNKLINSTIS